ncbi:UNVERIFIED_CONTAM: protein FAR1-RELATED SEQUENCE 5 [Sesamum latifolium]|uniref:Protein FAR1-RELATED SEQUENCE 5 n=1 Tax=Sesamum latifolium TaxID=2727402 RepID=A0AAW2Y950_9LAMI
MVMEFDSEEEAYNFYNEYAKAVGFGIRRQNIHKDANERIIDRTFCCACQGHGVKDKRDASVKSHRPETRTGCRAMMKINGRYNEKYKVINFIVDHNGHDLVSPSKTHFLRLHKCITNVQVLQADDISSSGIAPKVGYYLMSKQVGGRENVGFIFEDYKNYLHSKRTMEMKVGDAGGVLEYLQQKQLVDPNFFGAIQVDADDLIANIIWVDTQMMIDYSHFGDVVSFDTTYRKNKEGPFALFVGVNHHKQTIIFGAALLYDETTSTFIWLFDTFARAMSEKQPKTVFTDQDAAMAKALTMTWPNTCHRLCIWHIYQNATMHFSVYLHTFQVSPRTLVLVSMILRRKKNFYVHGRKCWTNMNLKLMSGWRGCSNLRENERLFMGDNHFVQI